MKRVTILLIAIALSGVSFADHTVPGGTCHRLYQDTARLEQNVRYSSLRWNVKDAVFRFYYAVERFTRCVGPHREGETRDHDTIPESCEWAMRDLHSTWYPVDRYLWDTYYDYPYVYQSYTRVRDDMRYIPHH